MSTRILGLFLLLSIAAWGANATEPAAVIRAAPLNPSRPYFIPTHPRVTTTIRFPHEIGAPDGSVSVFAEDAEKAGGAEYLVSWQSGEAYFTVTPLRNARLANLNVPYRGGTYVLYFYPVDDPLAAAASVALEEAGGPESTGTGGQPESSSARAAAGVPSSAPQVRRESALPDPDVAARTPARLLGFLDRLKLLHATEPGPKLAALAAAMNVQIAVSQEEAGTAQNKDAISAPLSGLNDYGWYQIILLQAVRDRKLNCIGFVCLIRNTSDRVLAFDVNSFGARAGAQYLVQLISDAAPILQPHEQVPAYFVIGPNAGTPLSAGNAWRISVDLLSPRLNPGAAIAGAFSSLP